MSKAHAYTSKFMWWLVHAPHLVSYLHTSGAAATEDSPAAYATYYTTHCSMMQTGLPDAHLWYGGPACKLLHPVPDAWVR
eukprot:jgi/Chrzof1/355/Cz01g12210.t1